MRSWICLSPSWRDNNPKYFLFPPLYYSYLKLIFLLTEFTVFWNLFSFLYKNLQFSDNITLISEQLTDFQSTMYRHATGPTEVETILPIPVPVPETGFHDRTQILKKYTNEVIYLHSVPR